MIRLAAAPRGSIAVRVWQVIDSGGGGRLRTRSYPDNQISTPHASHRESPCSHSPFGLLSTCSPGNS